MAQMRVSDISTLVTLVLFEAGIFSLTRALGYVTPDCAAARQGIVAERLNGEGLVFEEVARDLKW